jgi:biopolymer transport protein ExbD
MDFERRRRLVQEINLTALIDIVFHLMVFVMLTTTFVVSESMELSLPSAHAKTVAAPAGNVLRIRIVSDGSVVVDDKPMAVAQLNGLLASRLAVDPESKIALFTTAGVSVQQLITVMDTVYLTGGRNVQVDKIES